jgi:cell division protein FtsB
MQDDDHNLETIAWPGFVDILSSVIIMFVFFVMVVASALYFHIIIFKSQVLSEEAVSAKSQSKVEELAKTNRFLTEKIEEMKDEMKMLEEISDKNDIQLFKEDSEFSESEDQKIDISSEKNEITIFFDVDSISVTAANQTILNEEIGKYVTQYGADKIKATIISSKSPESLNDIVARRLAVARMLNVRNSFLETDIDPNDIKPVIRDGEAVDESYHWVRIRFATSQ